MQQEQAVTSIGHLELSATVIRCGCGLKTYEPDHKCPNPRIEELGVIAEGDIDA
jgi:hypothetical protein